MSERWTIEHARELYNVAGWSEGLFDISEEGRVEVRASGGVIDLPGLADDLVERGIRMPVLVRFSDVLQARVDALSGAFQDAIQQHAYQGSYRGVFPIKVNQQRQVVEEVVRFGRPHHLGLECGSKPELLVVLALLEDPDALIICNGYKDDEYLEMALLARKLGRQCVIVIEQASELRSVLRLSRELSVEPLIGVRTRLSTVGTGRWKVSSGDRAKFGLSVPELVLMVRELHAAGFGHCLQLLHFHIGSQISSIRRLRLALREGARIYAELSNMGSPMKWLDVGGGLGIDYDGSRTDFESSVNYDLPEYARTVVSAIAETCDQTGVPHPDIVTESGRALVAHASVLLVPVLHAAHRSEELAPDLPIPDADAVTELIALREALSARNPQEAYHRAAELREQTLMRFDMGLANLEERAAVEAMYWSICRRLWRLVKEHGDPPEDMEHLDRLLADTYYCNFSLFQSMPDSWAIGQLFPILPIDRLDEKPTRRGVIADITCDSDGRVDRFVDVRDVKRTLELHEPNGKPYYLGVFLLGAYQEILGDLHNLFGDTNVVHVSAAETARGYRIEAIVEGDRCSDVLRTVQYDPDVLHSRLRMAVERAYDSGKLTVAEGTRLLSTWRRGMDGYTYLA